jgi:hypothetical protein
MFDRLTSACLARIHVCLTRDLGISIGHVLTSHRPYNIERFSYLRRPLKPFPTTKSHKEKYHLCQTMTAQILPMENLK